MTTPAPTPGNGAQNSPGPGLARVLFPIAGIVLLAVAGLFFVRHETGAPKAARLRQTLLPPLLRLGRAEMRDRSRVAGLSALPFLKGEAVNASSLKSKISLINFWATWCEACMVEMPSIVKVYQGYKDRGFDVVAVDLDTNPSAVLPHTMQKYGMNFNVYTDEDSKLADLFQVQAIPLSVVIDHQPQNPPDRKRRARLERLRSSEPCWKSGWRANREMSVMTEISPGQSALPLFLTEENKARSAGRSWRSPPAMYLVSNHFHFLRPQELPRSWVDLAVPFMPSTVWIYVSEYIFFFVDLCRFKRHGEPQQIRLFVLLPADHELPHLSGCGPRLIHALFPAAG